MPKAEVHAEARKRSTVQRVMRMAGRPRRSFTRRPITLRSVFMVRWESTPRPFCAHAGAWHEDLSILFPTGPDSIGATPCVAFAQLADRAMNSQQFLTDEPPGGEGVHIPDFFQAFSTTPVSPYAIFTGKWLACQTASCRQSLEISVLS